MRKVLFVIPSSSNCGTNSSLSAIWNNLSDQYNLYVLPILNIGNSSYHFIDKAIESRLLRYYYGEFSSFSLKGKFLSFILKLFKRIIPNGKLDTLINKCAVRMIEKKYTFDSVVAFQEGLPTRITANFKCKNKIAWIHCDYSRAVPSDRDESNLYSVYSKIICVSNYTMNKFLLRYPSMKDKTTFIYNLFDAGRIITMSKDDTQASIMEPAFYNIISIGRMDPVKRFSFIPRIASELKKQNIKFRWYIVGGPQNDEYDHVSRSIMKYNVQDEVFLLGQMNNPYGVLSQSDLYVSTSYSEACPMVFLEAKALDVPIVSADFGSASEFVEDQYISDIEHLQEKIMEAYSNQTISKKSHNALSLIEEYNENIIGKLFHLFS